MNTEEITNVLEEVPDTIAVSVDDTLREITMYYALLSEVCTHTKYAASDGDYLTIYMDPIFQSTILGILLVPRDEKGRPEPDFSVESLKIMPSEAEKLIEWARQHSFNFFLKATLSMVKLGNLHQKLEVAMKATSTSSPDGTPD
ncbi:hypothetical protein [Kiloniella sp.]|uniref:hypothetical protein n=1 Tax=Kiloniella sp. TaxID=1938587 RepID=UPI003B01A5EF